MNTVTISNGGMGTASSDKTDATATPERDAQPSRRSLFTRATTAVAGFAAFLLLGTRTAQAEGETMAVGGVYTDATSTTGVATTSGCGLSGASSDPAGAGVYGSSSGSNPGVLGVCTGSGAGVHASSPAGIALAVTGRVIFSRSGLASVTKGRESVRVAVAGITPASLVLATLQSPDRGNYLAGVVPGTNQFTIYLNSAAQGTMKVAWFVIG
jgi:hypothetical protein